MRNQTGNKSLPHTDAHTHNHTHPHARNATHTNTPAHSAHCKHTHIHTYKHTHILFHSVKPFCEYTYPRRDTGNITLPYSFTMPLSHDLGISARSSWCPTTSGRFGMTHKYTPTHKTHTYSCIRAHNAFIIRRFWWPCCWRAPSKPLTCHLPGPRNPRRRTRFVPHVKHVLRRQNTY